MKNEIVNIFVDESDISNNALESINLSDNQTVNLVKIDIKNLDEEQSKINNISGAVLNLLSPETFSLYRGKFFQLISLNKNVYPLDSKINSTVALPKWSYISENVFFSDSAKIGLSTYIGPNSYVGANVKIGNFCWIGESVSIAPGVVIGNNVTIHNGVHIGGNAKVNKFNEIRKDVKSNTQMTGMRIDLDLFDSTAYIYGL